MWSQAGGAAVWASRFANIMAPYAPHISIYLYIQYMYIYIHYIYIYIYTLYVYIYVYPRHICIYIYIYMLRYMVYYDVAILLGPQNTPIFWPHVPNVALVSSIPTASEAWSKLLEGGIKFGMVKGPS